MPILDVSDAFDASFWDDFTVIRRQVTVDNRGRAQTTQVKIPGRGVVVASSPNDLQRLPEHEYFNKSISVTAFFRFQGVAKDATGTIITHPDQILWAGSSYVVRALDDYSHYGRGFVHVVAVSVDYIDPPPIPEPQGYA